MDQFNSSWRFIFKNFKNLISLGLPWLIFTIISLVLIANKLPQIQIDETVALDLAINQLMSTLTQFYENNASKLFIIDLMTSILFVAFIGSLNIQFKNISNMKTPQNFFKISKKIYLKIPYLFIASFITSILVQFGLLILIFPGVYLFARLSLYPIYISLENKGPLESLKCSWNATDEFGGKLTVYTLLIFILLVITTILTSSLLALTSIGLMFIVPVILFETAIFSMVLSYIYYSLYKFLEK
tara:strand:- start:6626 stop:7354 length:729 start_codon:yes stop_codon:yes gene_type:complete